MTQNISHSTPHVPHVTQESFAWPLLGCGAGLRAEHYNYILSEKPKISWFEAVSENFMDSGGRPLEILTRIRQDYPIALHGVSLSIGSADPLNENYLHRLKTLVEKIDPFIVSDHLCWSGVDAEHLHDLLPLPFTEEAVDYAASRIQKVQEYLNRRILIENVSTYVTYRHSTMPEWDFLKEVARRAGCGILLDLNNIYVNSKNHIFNPEEYLKNIPAELVGQFHLAGFTDMGDFLFDTHSSAVVGPVWDLYRKALNLYGPVSTLVEWDAAIPEFSQLEEEVKKAKKIYDEIDQTHGTKKKTIFTSKHYTSEISQENWKSLLKSQRELKTLIQPSRQPHSESVPENLLNPQGGVSGKQRMSVYAGGYTARMLEALTETYEAVKHLVGESAFAQMAEDYAFSYPSQDYNLTEAARHLPELLKKSAYLEKLPFLSDLARLERLLMESFHAFPKPVFDPSTFSKIPENKWESITLSFQPSVKIMSSPWPIFDLWNARKTPLKEIQIDLVDRPQNALIYRQGAEVKCILIDKNHFEAIQSFLSGKNLGQTCEYLENFSENEELPIMQWFSFWASNGLLAGVR